MQIRITKLRLAFAGLFVLAGVGLASLLSPLVGSALANVGQVVNISDHSANAYFAKVDSAGKLAVGDGAGPLSVDGTVTDRPAAPGSPWGVSIDIQGNLVLIAGPSAVPINVTSLSISTDEPSGSNLYVNLQGYSVPSSNSICGFHINGGFLWEIRDAGDGVTPLSFTFPTPLQFKPAANMKACVFAISDYPVEATIMNAVGFYGG
jgi:hypothetical protein